MLPSCSSFALGSQGTEDAEEEEEVTRGCEADERMWRRRRRAGMTKGWGQGALDVPHVLKRTSLTVEEVQVRTKALNPKP